MSDGITKTFLDQNVPSKFWLWFRWFVPLMTAPTQEEWDLRTFTNGLTEEVLSGSNLKKLFRFFTKKLKNSTLHGTLTNALSKEQLNDLAPPPAPAPKLNHVKQPEPEAKNVRHNQVLLPLRVAAKEKKNEEEKEIQRILAIDATKTTEKDIADLLKNDPKHLQNPSLSKQLILMAEYFRINYIDNVIEKKLINTSLQDQHESARRFVSSWQSARRGERCNEVSDRDLKDLLKYLNEAKNPNKNLLALKEDLLTLLKHIETHAKLVNILNPVITKYEIQKAQEHANNKTPDDEPVQAEEIFAAEVHVSVHQAARPNRNSNIRYITL